MRPLALIVAAMSFASPALADCYDDVYNSYDCYYAWDVSCDEAIAACDAQQMSTDPAYLLRSRFEATRTAPWRAHARHYYLTQSWFTEANSANACASGFHLARLAELMTSGALVYDLSRGKLAHDYSWGPPYDAVGYFAVDTRGSWGTVKVLLLAEGAHHVSRQRIIDGVLKQPSSLDGVEQASDMWLTVEIGHSDADTLPVWCIED